ncbi:MAG: gas vesicle protein GvpG [Ktedonobacterales bacterium]
MLMLKLLGDVLSAPIKGPVNGLEFILNAINDQVESEAFDESKVQGELMQLGLRYQAGEIDEAEYTAKEDALLQQLNEIRKFKESQAQEGAVTDEGATDSADTVVEEPGTAESGA